MYSVTIKQKAIKLRKSGKSIQDIAHTLSISRSTASHWCRDIPLSEQAIHKIAKNGKNKLLVSVLKHSEIKRAQRAFRTQEQKNCGAAMVKDINSQKLLFFGLGLYWGEGYKECNGELGFTNSNSTIIKFYIHWLGQFNVDKKDLIFRLTINGCFRKYEQEIKKFWIELLQIDEDQFSKTTMIKTSLKKASLQNINQYKGILRVKVRKGLGLKNQILGAIDYVSSTTQNR